MRTRFVVGLLGVLVAGCITTRTVELRTTLAVIRGAHPELAGTRLPYAVAVIPVVDGDRHQLAAAL
jgi:hypothetical protein